MKSGIRFTGVYHHRLFVQCSSVTIAIASDNTVGYVPVTAWKDWASSKTACSPELTLSG